MRDFIDHNITVPRITVPPTPSLDELSTALSRCCPLNAVDCVNWNDYPAKPDVYFRIGADEERLYVLFDVRGNGLKAMYTDDNDPVWQDSCVEVFIQAPDGEGYFNFEMNCIGTLLAAKRKARNEDVVHFTPDIMSHILRLTSLPREPFAEKSGTHGWSAAVGIPFSVLGFAEGERPHSLRANFYKCADGTTEPHYLSWAPISTPAPDFHRPEFFGELVFE